MEVNRIPFLGSSQVGDRRWLLLTDKGIILESEDSISPTEEFISATPNH